MELIYSRKMTRIETILKTTDMTHDDDDSKFAVYCATADFVLRN